MNYPLDEVFFFDVITSSSAGAAADADSTPTFEVFEESTDTDIGVGGNLTKRTSKTGNYRGSFTLSAANGFEVGKFYSVVASATVGGVAAKAVAARFRVTAAEATAGYTYATIKSGTGTGELALAAGSVVANLLGYIIFYVGKGGSDSNDGRSWTTRKLTIAGASEGTLGGACAVAAVSNTKTLIFVGPGEFSEVNKINLRQSSTNGINLWGSGRESTIIRSSVTLTDPGGSKTNVYRGCGIAPGPGTELCDFTVNGLDVGDGNYFGVGQNNSFDGLSASWSAKRIAIIADSDGIYDRYFGGAGESPDGIGQTITLEDVIVATKWHAFRFFWSWQRIICRRCVLSVYGPSLATDTEDQACPLRIDNGHIIAEDCTLLGVNGVLTTYGVCITGPGLVELRRTSIKTTSATGTVNDIAVGGGEVRSHAAHYDASKTSGNAVTIVPAHGVDVNQWRSETVPATNTTGVPKVDALLAEGSDFTGVIDARITAANLATAAALQAVDDLIDTEVAAIKAKTDQLPASFPSNFASMTISVDGDVSIAQTFPTNFSLLTINGSGQVVSSNAGSVDLDPVLAAIAALPGTAVGTALNFICPINAKLSFLVNNSKSQQFSATDFDSTGWTQFVFTIKADANDADEDALIIVRVTNPASGSDGLLRSNGASATANLASLAVVVEDGDTLVTLELAAAAMSIQPSPDGKPYRWELTRWTNGVKVPMGRGEFVALPSLSGSIMPP